MAEYYIGRKHHADGESSVGSVSFVNVYLYAVYIIGGGVLLWFFKPSPNSYTARLYIRVSDHALGVLVFNSCFDHAFKTTLCLLVVIRLTRVLLEVLYFLCFFSSRD